MKPYQIINNLIVIKVGSNVLTLENGTPDLQQMISIVHQIAQLRANGCQVILVSSGAVAYGRKEISLANKLDLVLKKQIWAAAGQIELMKNYKNAFNEVGLQIAQILVTKEDFRDRKHYLNMKNCLNGLITSGIIPIINENDTVSITELMFTDNDELASLTAAMVNAGALILLTNVDGVFNGSPNDPDSTLIPVIGNKLPELQQIVSPVKSSFGRGGMHTKLSMAKKSADLGITVFIANGKKKNILIDFLSEKMLGTRFEPSPTPHPFKKFLAYGSNYYKGVITINQGAENALLSNNVASVLPIGIIHVEGIFEKGDIIKINNEQHQCLGLGKAEYSQTTLLPKLAEKNQKPFIHYDYLYLFDHE
jgi:glutamate 5-kinase